MGVCQHKPPFRGEAHQVEVPAEGAGGPGGHPAGTDLAPMGLTGCSDQPGWIKKEVRCAFSGLDDEPLRQAQQRDPEPGSG
ncbi:unnamed protein product [Lampetra fluviatilis]